MIDHPASDDPTGYEVWVDDNFHFLDESERCLYGRYGTHEEAEAVAKGIVDRFFETDPQSEQSAEELYDAYVMFGEDPFIVGPNSATMETDPETGDLDLRPRFSAWDYARQRSEEIVAARNRPSPPMSP